MDFWDVINTRESVRDYDPTKKVPQPILDKIVEAGRLAPSAANRQPWEFVVVSSEETLNHLKKCYGNAWFKDAPHVLIVKGCEKKAWKRSSDGVSLLETDLAIAMTYILLAATNEGIGTCCMAAFDHQILREAVPLGECDVVYAITPLGYPKAGHSQKGAKIRKPISEIVKFL